MSALNAAVAGSTVPADATLCHLAVAGSLASLVPIAPGDVALQDDIITGQSHSDSIGQQLQAPMTLVAAIAARLASDVMP